MMNNSTLFLDVSEILFCEWDPIRINNNELVRDEYDGYVSGVVNQLLSGVDESHLACHLSQIQQDNMGMSVTDEEQHRRVAHRHLDLLADK
jgi:hypothetical protein